MGGTSQPVRRALAPATPLVVQERVWIADEQLGDFVYTAMRGIAVDVEAALSQAGNGFERNRRMEGDHGFGDEMRRIAGRTMRPTAPTPSWPEDRETTICHGKRP